MIADEPIYLITSKITTTASFTSIITTSRKKVYTTKRPSKYSNIGTLKNPPFSKKIYVIIRDLTAMQHEMNRRFDAVDKRFEQLTRRMDLFMFWSFATTLSVGGLVVAALKLWP